MKSRIALPLSVIVVLSALSIPLEMNAQATFITFEVPDAIRTSPVGINQTGEVAGSYTDTHFVPHGFLRERHGTIIRFDVPDAIRTVPNSINPAGVITGTYYIEVAAPHGFLRERHGSFIRFDVPDSVNTSPSSINPAGVITGYYSDASLVFH